MDGVTTETRPIYMTIKQRVMYDEMLNEIARKRVRRGIKRLNKVYPAWANNIQLPELQLQDGQHCVLGQVAPKLLAYLANDDEPHQSAAYSAGVVALYPESQYDTEKEAVKSGFVKDDLIDWPVLNYVWERAIGRLQRRALRQAERAERDA